MYFDAFFIYINIFYINSIAIFEIYITKYRND